MKRLAFFAAIAAATITPAFASGPVSPETFKASYNMHAKDMLPALKTTECKTITAAKKPGKTITECSTVADNSLLSIDGFNNRFDGAWLVVDVRSLPSPSDITRAGGLLLRVAKGYQYGNHLALAQEAVNGARKHMGKPSCIDDPASASRLCVSTNDGSVYSMTLGRAESPKA